MKINVSKRQLKSIQDIVGNHELNVVYFKIQKNTLHVHCAHVTGWFVSRTLDGVQFEGDDEEEHMIPFYVLKDAKADRSGFVRIHIEPSFITINGVTMAKEPNQPFTFPALSNAQQYEYATYDGYIQDVERCAKVCDMRSEHEISHVVFQRHGFMYAMNPLQAFRIETPKHLPDALTLDGAVVPLLVKAFGKKSVMIGMDQDHVQLSTDDTTIIMKKMDLETVDRHSHYLNQLCELTSDETIRFLRADDVRDAMEHIIKMKQTKPVAVIDANTQTIRARSNTAVYEQRVDMSGKQGAEEIIISPKALLLALKVWQEDEIKMSVIQSRSAIRITDGKLSVIIMLIHMPSAKTAYAQ